MRFTVTHRDGATRARVGRMETSHGAVDTPAFMPVGTRATVKALAPSQIEETGAQILLGNTYHLHLRPGEELVAKMGGLHGFMGWSRPILTDSGGYQVWSLAKLRKLDDEGARFNSHIDGAPILLTPEKVVAIQRKLGSDILMPLDQPADLPFEEKQAAGALDRTTKWLARSATAWRSDPGDSALFAIVQGAIFRNLRQRAVEQCAAFDLPGHAIGGLSLGEPAETLYEIVDFTAAMLPESKPRYLMGVGTPGDIARAVCSGIDMFDCVLPTRLGRNGWAFTSEGMIKIRNAEWKEDARPVDPACRCACCRTFSRAYIRHLFSVEEILGLSMLSLHNLSYYAGLMARLRDAIRAGTIRAVADEESRRCPPLSTRA